MKKVLVTIFSLILIVIVAITIYIFIPKAKNVEGIFVAKTPTKIDYYVGEMANFTDIEVYLVYSNGSKEKVSYDELKFEGFDSSRAVDKQAIYVQYKEKYYTKFYVFIHERIEIDYAVEKIVLTYLPFKTEYKVGELFDADGGVISIVYKDNHIEKVNLRNSYVYGFDSSKPNDNLVLTVKYKEKGKIYTTTFSVVIKE